VPVSQQELKKSTIGTGLAVFCDSRQHFSRPVSEGISSAQFSRRENGGFSA
jgi:hypothetical protein